MGISLSAYKTFKKEIKQFVRPKVESIMQFDADNKFPDFNKYYSLISKTRIHSSFDSEFCELDYNEDIFKEDKKNSQKFFNQVKKLKDSPMKQWMLSHEGKFISFNYEYGFWVSSKIEIIEREVYVASDYIRVNEDCRILSGTFHSMKERYGINLDAFISGDFLNCYLPEAIDHVEKMLNNINSISIAEEAEKKLEFIVKQEDDKDFDERMLRVKKIIDVFKQSAIFVTRV